MGLFNKLFGNERIEKEIAELRMEQELAKLRHEREMQEMKFKHEEEMAKLKANQKKAPSYKMNPVKSTNTAKLELAKQVGDITDKQITFIKTIQITLHKNHRNAVCQCKTKKEASIWISAHIDEFKALQKR